MLISILFGVLTLVAGYFSLFLNKRFHKAIFYPIFVGLFIFTWLSTIGIPKPDDLNLFHRKGDLIAQKLDEDNHVIYVWVSFKGDTKPTSLEIPWVDDTARQLHDAEKNKQQLKVELPSLKEKVVAKLSKLHKDGIKLEGQASDRDNDGDASKLQQSHGKVDPTKANGLNPGAKSGDVIFYPDMHISNNPPKQGDNS